MSENLPVPISDNRFLQPASSEVLKAHSFTGFARHFERRPEYLFRSLVPEVIDASPVPKWDIHGIQVFSIAEVFSGSDEVFLGFGKPNVYLTVPDGKGGYEKFAGLSLKRGPSLIQDTKGRVQSGILIRFRNLPTTAVPRLRAAMQKHHGKRYWTCVNANLCVLQDAGFAAPRTQLNKLYFPYQLLRVLIREGLTFDGQPISFDVIRTAPDSIEQHTWGITEAEATTGCRHAEHALEKQAKKSIFFAILEKLRHAPKRLSNILMPPPAAPPAIAAPIAPPLAVQQECPADLQIRVSSDSLTGMALRQLWGPHTLFETRQTRVDINAYLPNTLRAFPQKNPSALTRLKKTLLFSPPVVKAIRGVLSPRMLDIGYRSPVDIYNMLRTHSEVSPNKYNLVITGSRIIIARTTVQVKAVDWVLTKHVLMSGYDPDVRFSGEVWKDTQGVIRLNNNSGTYQPSQQQLLAAHAYMQAVFNTLAVQIDEPAPPPLEADPPIN